MSRDRAKFTGLIPHIQQMHTLFTPPPPDLSGGKTVTAAARWRRFPTRLLAVLALLVLLAFTAAGGWLLPAELAQAQDSEQRAHRHRRANHHQQPRKRRHLRRGRDHRRGPELQ